MNVFRLLTIAKTIFFFYTLLRPSYERLIGLKSPNGSHGLVILSRKSIHQNRSYPRALDFFSTIYFNNISVGFRELREIFRTMYPRVLTRRNILVSSDRRILSVAFSRARVLCTSVPPDLHADPHIL